MPARAMNLLIMIVSIVLISTSALAGPLTPPGAPSPTHKTLTEVEPRIAINATNTPGGAFGTYHITSPGSYYLTENLAGAINVNGLYVNTTGHVTIDLNGFELVGDPGSATGIGIFVAVGTSVHISNGAVKDFPQGGINTVAGVSATLENIDAHNNNSDGLYVGNYSIVISCKASNNNGNGIRAGVNSVISNCTTNDNAGAGINASTASTISNCNAYNNSSSGIFSGDGSTISGCTVFSNGSHGIFANTGSHVSGNSSRLNDGDGFNVVGGSYIFNNNATANDGDGIETAGDSYVLNNNCDSNDLDGTADGAGIRVTGTDTKVEGNNVGDNWTGITTQTGGCLVIKNSAANNSVIDFDLHPSTTYGPIVDASGGGDLSSLADPNNSHPMANFWY